MIYLDNAATSFFKPDEVIEAVDSYLRNPGNPNRGVNVSSVRSGTLVFDTRFAVSDFFGNNDFSKVVFTSGITESLNTVINGVISSDDHVITTYLEHNSTLRPLYRTGCKISFTDGTPSEIEKCFQKNTKAVFVNHASNVTGEVQDIEAIGKICREKGVLFVVDSAQSAGIIPININSDCIDVLCFTGHKGLLGLQGSGGLVINTDYPIVPLKVGGTGIHSFDKRQPGEYPAHLEAGTLNVPGIVALNAAIKFITEYGIEKIYSHELMLKSMFLEEIKKKDNVVIYENKSKKTVGTISFNILGIDAAKVGDFLSEKYEICVRTGAHCAPLVLEHYGIDSCVRVSFSIHNTEQDVSKLLYALNELV